MEADFSIVDLKKELGNWQAWPVPAKYALLERLEEEVERREGLNVPDFPVWCEGLRVDGHQFTFEKREYLREPYADKHPWQVDQKATQVGGTVRAVLRVIYGSKYLGFRNVLYYFPTSTHVKEFSKGRIKPFIEENPEVSKWLKETDSVSLKQIGSGFLYMLGMSSSIEVKNIPANMLVFDEFDEAPQINFDKAMERLGGQMEEHEVCVHLLSNPTLPDYGVSRAFEETDQRYWLLKCRKCGNDNCLEDGFMAWVDGKGPPPLLGVNGGNAIRACLKCQEELYPAEGRWVAKRPDVTDKRGYHFSQLFSQTWMHSPDKILSKWINAQNTGNLSDFFNLTIGIGYIEAENRLSEEEVLRLCGDEGVASSDEGPCYMGVDQGKDLHVVVGKTRDDGSGKVPHLGIYKDWEDLDRLMEEFHVVRCVVDAMPETRNARTFAEKFRGKVFLCHYNIHQKGHYRWNEDDMIVQVNRTESLDASHRVIQKGELLLPKKCGVTKDFAYHCHNTARKLEEIEEVDQKTRMKRKTGEKRYVYVKLGADHFRHAFNYEEIARGQEAFFGDCVFH